jgi:hypothetical protein
MKYCLIFDALCVNLDKIFQTPNIKHQAPIYCQIPMTESEAPRPQAGASRKGNFVHIVLLDPAYKAGLAGHVPVKSHIQGRMFWLFECLAI